MKRPIVTIFALLVTQLCVIAQGESYEKSAFFIGDHESYYHQLTSNHRSSLLEASDNSMSASYENWTKLMKELETFCFEKHMDIRGTKLWINVFWNKDGNIENIVFHPKHNSKKLDYHQLKSLFTLFIQEAPTQIAFDQSYAHYGSASFPIISNFDLADQN